MNGPAHYRTAETLLSHLRREISGSPGSSLHTTEQQSRMIAEAQVHATLALAAATIETAAARGPGDVEQVWIEAVR